jgi:BioD-like phosphotransacetylase family protein
MRVYIAATRQNDGKTIASLGLIASVIERARKVGYIKPVGQHCVEIGGHKIDEDAILIRETYGLDCDLPDMSPVAVPRGFTESYIHDPQRGRLVEGITSAYRRVAADKDFILIEGTGHAGVGSVFDMSNADVAELLDAKVILISSGGVGRPIDEIMLNKALFDAKGVRILGAIINKVQPEKYEKIAPIVRSGLSRKGVDVLGVMPYNPVLSSPTLEQLLEDIGGELLSDNIGIRNVIDRMVIGAMPPHEALDYFGHGVLLITPGTREDLVLAAMSSCAGRAGSEYSVSGVILTGGIRPHSKVMELIRRTHIPIISVPEDTFSVATKVNSLMVKIRPGDKSKIEAAERIVSEYVDVDRILDMLYQPEH